MQIMELWNSFTEEKMNKAEINQLLGETCEKHFDYMVEFHRSQAESVTEMWQAMRDKMTMMATKVFDMVNRQDEIHQKQEHIIIMLKVWLKHNGNVNLTTGWKN